MIRRLLLLALFACNGDKDGPADDDVQGDDDDDDDDDVGGDSAGDSGSGPDNDTIENAEPITAPDGESFVDGEIESPGDRDFYVLDGVAGHIYQLYGAGGGDAGEPDLVIRVYGPDQALLAENDDLPYRMVGTNPGLFFRADVAGTYFVEVLEYSDWAGDDPVGNATFDYTLEIFNFPVWPELNENQFADNDTPSQAFENTFDQDGDTYPEGSWYSAGWGEEDLFQAEAPGAIDVAGDEDWLWISAAEGAPIYCQFSEFPGLATAADLTYELYREDCDPTCDGAGADLVASTTEPHVGTGYGFLTDAGITYPMFGPALYYLRIIDADGSGGADHWYSALYSCYVAELATTEIESGEVDVEAGQNLPVTVSETDATFKYGRFVGSIDGRTIGGPDDGDAWVVDWAEAGDTVDVFVETTVQGSLLTGATVVVWHEDSPGTWSQLGTASGAVPSVLGLVAPDGNRLAVSITSASGDQGPGQFYLGLVQSYIPTP